MSPAYLRSRLLARGPGVAHVGGIGTPRGRAHLGRAEPDRVRACGERECEQDHHSRDHVCLSGAHLHRLLSIGRRPPWPSRRHISSLPYGIPHTDLISAILASIIRLYSPLSTWALVFDVPVMRPTTMLVGTMVCSPAAICWATFAFSLWSTRMSPSAVKQLMGGLFRFSSVF